VTHRQLLHLSAPPNLMPLPPFPLHRLSLSLALIFVAALSQRLPQCTWLNVNKNILWFGLRIPSLSEVPLAIMLFVFLILFHRLSLLRIPHYSQNRPSNGAVSVPWKLCNMDEPSEPLVGLTVFGIITVAITSRLCLNHLCRPCLCPRRLCPPPGGPPEPGPTVCRPVVLRPPVLPVIPPIFGRDERFCAEGFGPRGGECDKNVHMGVCGLPWPACDPAGSQAKLRNRATSGVKPWDLYGCVASIKLHYLAHLVVGYRAACRFW
jgi:hypothetical protein